MKVKVTSKKPVVLTANEYSSMMEEMENLRRGLDQYKAWCSTMNTSLNEAREQVDTLHGTLAERDALIQELNDQITATEEECGAELSSCRSQIMGLKQKLEKAEADASSGMSTLAKFWEEATNEKFKAEERAEDYRIQLMESDARVDALEKRVEWLAHERDDWKAAAENYQAAAIALQGDKEALVVATHEMEDNYQTLLAENTDLVGEVMDLKTELKKASADVERWKKAAADNVEMAKDFHLHATEAEKKHDVLKKAFDELYENNVDLSAKVQYSEAQKKQIDTLARQLKANEEEYDNLRKMYVDLRTAANNIASVVRTNTFAN